MSDLILVESVNSVINNINEDNKSYKSDKTYNIDYNINDRLKFLKDKYKDYEFNINKNNSNNIRFRKKGTKQFRDCCINFDCITRPNFCIEGEIKPTHCGPCSKLAEEENIIMIDIYAKNKKCIVCKKTQPSFCKIGEIKPTHCGTCREDEMINIYAKKCIVCKETRACYCKIGESKATYCGHCAKIVSIEQNIEMICLYAKKCKNIIDGIQCKTIVTEKYDGYCFQCYYKINPTEIPVKNIKIKENNVVEFIKLIYTQKNREKYKIINIIYDKSVGKTQKCPDINIICENYVIVVEVDEFQHKKESQPGRLYSKENEENKMKLIKEYYKSINKKTIYIRFNPDDYKNKNNIKIKSPWKEDENGVLKLINETNWKNRLEILKQKIDYYLKKKEIKNNSTNYLFYDGYKI